MIIDLTRKPCLVLPDECADSVVVRSIGNRDVSGLVSFQYTPYRATKTRHVDLIPDAKMVRGNSTCFETRLLLPGTTVVENPYAGTPDYIPAWAREQQKATILPDPYEVASVFKDPVTNFAGTWRLGIRIEKHKKLFLVTVQDMNKEGMLVTLAVKGLDPNPHVLETLPLAKLTRTVASGTAWDRILGDD